jgi:hypothetical protein
MKISLAAILLIFVLFPSAPAISAQSKAWHCILYTKNAGKDVRFSSTPVLTDADATTLNAAWKQYVITAYHVSDPNAYGGCQALAGTLAQQEMVVTSAEDNYKRLGAQVVQVRWTSAPGQTLPSPTPSTASTHDVAAPAKPAAAPAPPAPPAALTAKPAGPPTNYVWCHSAWEGTVGTKLPAGTILYFSDVFAGAIPPPPPGTTDGNGWAQQNASVTFQPAFFAFLQKKYAFKNGGNYPVSCSASDPLTPAGLQNAQKRRQEYEDMTRQFNGQVVETGWSGQ